MYKAEIKTDAGVYEVIIEGATDIKAAWKHVEDTLAAYMPFENEDELIVIAAGASLKHIRIWDPEKRPSPMKMVEEPGEDPVIEGIFDWETTATYLGQNFKLAGVGHRKKGTKPVYMAVTINGGPAGEALDTAKLNELLMYWRESEGDSPGTYVIYKLPEGLIVEAEDAGSFLLEAVKGVGYTTDNKTATASFDWRGSSD